jgi:hypothetical protein
MFGKKCNFILKKERSKMGYIILTKNSWSQYEVIKNRLDLPRIFETEAEAEKYIESFQLWPTQIINLDI